MPGLPPLIGQSAFEKQGSAAALLHVSHMHLPPTPPEQFGLDEVMVRVSVPVELVRLTVRVAMTVPVSVGQSRLVDPKSGRFGTAPLASQLFPDRMPPEQVPPATLSLIVVSPMHRGHGSSTEGP
jgi:hypothetical protein